MAAANRDNPPRTGHHVCQARKRPIYSRTSRDPDGRSNCDRQCLSHSFGADQCRRATTTLTFHAFNNEGTPSWCIAWSLCSNRPVCLPSVEESTIPRRPILATMEAGIVAKHAAQKNWLSPRQNLTDGDVVLMKEEGTHCNNWPIGRITEAIQSEDGQVRKVRVELIRDGKNKAFPRSLLFWCPQELVTASRALSATHRSSPHPVEKKRKILRA